MPKEPNHIPKYCHHSASGQAIVTLDGHDIYLGKWNTADSRSLYDRKIGEWIAGGRKLPADPQSITVAEVVDAFRKHAKVYYRDPDGGIGKQAVCFDYALKPVLRLYAKLPAKDFGALKLKAVRESLISEGRVRTNINKLIGMIKHVFKWTCENEMIPATVHLSLSAVGGLQAGRTEAVESERIKPVLQQHVDEILPHVSAQVAAMVKLQLLSAMRPGEVVIIRGADLDTTGKLWIYRPSRHKNQWRGLDRTIYLGPKRKK